MRRLTVLSSATSAVRSSPGASRASSGGSASSGVVAPASQSSSAATSGSAKIEAAALPGRALDLQLVAHRLDQVMADRQAQPGAAGGGARRRSA